MKRDGFRGKIPLSPHLSPQDTPSTIKLHSSPHIHKNQIGDDNASRRLFWDASFSPPLVRKKLKKKKNPPKKRRLRFRTSQSPIRRVDSHDEEFSGISSLEEISSELSPLSVAKKKKKKKKKKRQANRCFRNAGLRRLDSALARQRDLNAWKSQRDKEKDKDKDKGKDKEKKMHSKTSRTRSDMGPLAPVQDALAQKMKKEEKRSTPKRPKRFVSELKKDGQKRRNLIDSPGFRSLFDSLRRTKDEYDSESSSHSKKSKDKKSTSQNDSSTQAPGRGECLVPQCSRPPKSSKNFRNANSKRLQASVKDTDKLHRTRAPAATISPRTKTSSPKNQNWTL